MSVLIKGMKIPKSCADCDLLELSGAIGCKKAYQSANEWRGRALDCPLIELTNHGDLIDKDRFHHNLKVDAIENFTVFDDKYLHYLEGLKKAEELLLGEPVIIPAEKGED